MLNKFRIVNIYLCVKSETCSKIVLKVKMVTKTYSRINQKVIIQSMISNCHTFFPKKTAKKCDNWGRFTQKILFLDYNKTKKAKRGTI